jgi:2-phosphoglycerate kinase
VEKEHLPALSQALWAAFWPEQFCLYGIMKLMKNLIIVGGTMGVGKTATCRELQKILPRNVFLDGDWCLDMHPFVVTEETKAMVMR